MLLHFRAEDSTSNVTNGTTTISQVCSNTKRTVTLVLKIENLFGWRGKKIPPLLLKWWEIFPISF